MGRITPPLPTTIAQEKKEEAIGLAALIVVLCLLCLLCIICVVCAFLRRRPEEKEEEPPQPVPEPPAPEPVPEEPVAIEDDWAADEEERINELGSIPRVAGAHGQVVVQPEEFNM